MQKNNFKRRIICAVKWYLFIYYLHDMKTNCLLNSEIFDTNLYQ